MTLAPSALQTKRLITLSSMLAMVHLLQWWKWGASTTISLPKGPEFNQLLAARSSSHYHPHQSPFAFASLQLPYPPPTWDDTSGHPLGLHSCGMLERQSLLVTHFVASLWPGRKGRAGCSDLGRGSPPLGPCYLYHWSDWGGHLALGSSPLTAESHRWWEARCLPPCQRSHAAAGNTGMPFEMTQQSSGSVSFLNVHSFWYF